MDMNVLPMTEILERLKKLETDIALLQAENARLQAEIVHVQAENAELHRRLGLNSHKSHQPPSSNGYRKKTVKPALPKGEKRAVGGQVGHNGRTLRAVRKSEKVQVHLAECCCVCQRVFRPDEPYRVVGQRQVFDLPEPKLAVTEHQVGERVCCGQAQRGQYPASVSSPVQYGPGVRGWIVKLSFDHKMPVEPMSQLFSDLYG